MKILVLIFTIYPVLVYIYLYVFAMHIYNIIDWLIPSVIQIMIIQGNEYRTGTHCDANYCSNIFCAVDKKKEKKITNNKQ